MVLLLTYCEHSALFVSDLILRFGVVEVTCVNSIFYIVTYYMLAVASRGIPVIICQPRCL